MKKYLRFYAAYGWVQASPPGTGSTTPTEALVDMSDFSMAMAFDSGGSHLRFINHDGTAFFTVEFQPTTNDCWAQSLLTEINKTIVRAAGEGWQKVIYDIGEGVQEWWCILLLLAVVLVPEKTNQGTLKDFTNK